MAGSLNELLRRQLNRSAQYNLLAVPGGGVRAIEAPSKGVVGLHMELALHRFQIDVLPPSMAAGLAAANTAGEVLGRMELRLLVLPPGFLARPDREPPAEPLDRSRSQRVVLQEAAVTFGDGPDAFRGFGAGRTFPKMTGGRPRLVVAIVGDVFVGHGKLRGHEGNFVLCGDLGPRIDEAGGAFTAHVMARFGDLGNELCTADPMPPIAAVPDPDPHTTYFTCIAKKGEGPDQVNHFSIAPGGRPRGVNIPVELERVCVDCGLESGGGIRASALGIGEVIGREIGFGRETAARAAHSGTPLTPFQFEGVSEYFLDDADGRTVGSFVVNFFEGRTILTTLPEPPGQPALRFGYFGAVMSGRGELEGLRGMMYGNGRSVFDPAKPSEHVISNHYVIRIDDPDGRFRAPGPGPGC